MKIPLHCRIATPSGVGDVYWVLCKLKDFRKKNNIEHVTLCVQKSPFTRALDWSKMVDFVDATEELEFQPDQALKMFGFSRAIKGADVCLWPNYVIDRGNHLSKWLPQYQLDMDFKIATVDVDPPGTVVYASSVGVNNGWFPGRGPAWWSELLEGIAVQTGRPATLIGSPWDMEFTRQISGPCRNLVGKTTLPQVTGILAKADLVIGIISGMTILANHFATPCIAIYPDKFKPGFLTSWIKTGIPYTAVKASQVTSPASILKRGEAFYEHRRSKIHSEAEVLREVG